MKRFLLIISFLTIATLSSLAQTDQRFCPKIVVTGPPGITNPGEKMEFRVSVSGIFAGLRYEWTVSHGEIVEGQGTLSITISGLSKDETGTNVEAKVKVGPMPNGCETTASEMAAVAGLPTSCPGQQWGKIKPNEERAQYDSFFAELENNPTDKGFILLSITQQEKLGSTNARILFATKHAKFRKFDISRLVFGLVASDEPKTTVWRMPPGTEPPCKECLIVEGAFVN
jgi:hypothetical protein